MKMFDLQVNGYGGVDFNQDALTPEDLHKACSLLESDGVESILATVITDSIDAMVRRVTNLVKLRERDALAARVIAGLHIEGPFLNEELGYRGAHPVDAIHPANTDDMQRILDAAQGLTRLVTLAPERDAKCAVTRMLVEKGVVVSAGHCNPSLEVLQLAIESGLGIFTHLGNGCPVQLPRHDNIIQRALSLADKIYVCFIADGVHVPFFALRNYIRSAGLERCIVVSDAMAAAGLGPGRYRLARWEVEVGDDLAVRSPDRSHLVGSAIKLRQSVTNLIEHIALSESEAMQLTTVNPRRAVPINGV